MAMKLMLQKRNQWNRYKNILKARYRGWKYSEFLEYYKLRELIKKYSDYIHYPIKIEQEVPAGSEGDGADKKIITKKRMGNNQLNGTALEKAKDRNYWWRI